MKYIVFGNIDMDMKTVLNNIPYNIEYIITNVKCCEAYEGKNVYTSAKLYQEDYNNIYIFIANMENYVALADQLVKMGFMEGKHFASAMEYLYNQWEKIEYFDDLFIVRMKQMTTYISKQSRSILDLGCGNRELECFLNVKERENIQYYGVDYVDRGNNTIVCDFNKGEFPDKKTYTVFCSGCLEYIEDVNQFIKNMCRSCEEEIILSYCPLEYKGDIMERRKQGWKNHMTIRQLVEQLQYHGFSIECGTKSIGCNVIFKFTNRRKNIIKAVQENRLTYLEEYALEDLLEAVEETKHLEGCIIETGCALGGSSICMAYTKPENKALFVYDVFGMIPEPGEKDGEDVLARYDVIKSGRSQGIGGDLYYGYQDNLLKVVENNFCTLLNINDLQSKNISLIKGLFEDTLLCQQAVSLAHIDCDWYDSVMVCLERIVPHLVPGGILVIDDYYHWSGSREAVDDYFKDKKEYFSFEKKSRLHIRKK